MEKFNYMVGITFILFLFMITSCSYTVEKNTKNDIAIEPLDSIQKIDCEADNIKKLDIAKCKMETRLLELKY